MTNNHNFHPTTRGAWATYHARCEPGGLWPRLEVAPPVPEIRDWSTEDSVGVVMLIAAFGLGVLVGKAFS